MTSLGYCARLSTPTRFCQVWRHRNKFSNFLACIALSGQILTAPDLNVSTELLVPASLARDLTEPHQFTSWGGCCLWVVVAGSRQALASAWPPNRAPLHS